MSVETIVNIAALFSVAILVSIVTNLVTVILVLLQNVSMPSTPNTSFRSCSASQHQRASSSDLCLPPPPSCLVVRHRVPPVPAQCADGCLPVHIESLKH